LHGKDMIPHGVFGGISILALGFGFSFCSGNILSFHIWCNLRFIILLPGAIFPCVKSKGASLQLRQQFMFLLEGLGSILPGWATKIRNFWVIIPLYLAVLNYCMFHRWSLCRITQYSCDAHLVGRLRQSCTCMRSLGPMAHSVSRCSFRYQLYLV